MSSTFNSVCVPHSTGVLTSTRIGHRCRRRQHEASVKHESVCDVQLSVEYSSSSAGADGVFIALALALFDAGCSLCYGVCWCWRWSSWRWRCCGYTFCCCLREVQCSAGAKTLIVLKCFYLI
jgi:hypothetical protein